MAPVGGGGKSVATRPARGTRPRNRRRLIIEAAADLFYKRGYGDVTMSEVAEAVAIGPSALYRHFRGKDDLLEAVVEDSLDNLEDALRAVDTSADIAETLAGVILQRRSVGVLWRREARYLTAQGRRRLRTIARRIGQRLAAHIRQLRPNLGSAEADLLAWCALGVANSVSFHRLSLPEPAFTALLSELIAMPLHADVDLFPADHGEHHSALAVRSRREAILSAATILFAEKGFSATSIDDIGAAVGIAGPSVYNHFAAKTDILSAAIFRGNESLWRDFSRAVAGATDPASALARVVHSYQVFAFENPYLVATLLSETAYLPEPDCRNARRAQREYIDEWVHLATQVHLNWTPIEARIRIQACQMMINDVVQIRHLRSFAGINATLADIAGNLLEVTPSNQS
ncbi:TetR family transcriptional regulator [Mycobacterium shimoidei]|uniref:TetR family transcriptional regulator n=1 Tax=Mycobacterium shimoidei TaxID=29313 RepID=UPI00084920A3|nr:TetR family transcriptional regulator [Mycobacterium shimoidei]MCV7260054.1 TetR family transcriptional regulator [Mycobacterium shimoidei]ODR14922.1 hypothetical protein BHQ16_02430 [Mycobacterium shimoidei]ORW79090.1 hypothetical protein AWC26_15845 [Mycobacterium shimoidei]